MIYLNDLGIISPLGNSHEAIRQNMLLNPRSGITMSDAWKPFHLPLGLSVPSGNRTVSDLPILSRSRNNLFALSALDQIRPSVDAAIKQFGRNRIGVIVGTSTSGIAESERAFSFRKTCQCFPEDFHYAQQELGSLSELIANELGLTGPAYVHSSACASGAKSIASAARLLEAGICDAIIAGGVDTLSAFVIAGFSALDAISPETTLPFSKNRQGINLGEGAAFFLMSRVPSGIALAGWGEASDGHHISAPDPEGKGAGLAITQALEKAGINAKALDYINLHGTGTQQNDAMEAKIIHEMAGVSVFCSSTKAMTGHTLGAAGAVEAGLCWIAMQDNMSGLVPPHLYDGEYDTGIAKINLAGIGAQLGHPIRYCLSTSFAFGGANAALVMEGMP